VKRTRHGAAFLVHVWARSSELSGCQLSKLGIHSGGLRWCALLYGVDRVMGRACGMSMQDRISAAITSMSDPALDRADWALTSRYISDSRRNTAASLTLESANGRYLTANVGLGKDARVRSEGAFGFSVASHY
jgi:hypothetical protein